MRLQKYVGRRAALAAFAVCAGTLLGLWFRWEIWSGLTRLPGRHTVSSRLTELGPASRNRLREAFDHEGVPFPPTELVLVGLKSERELRVYAASEGDSRHVLTFGVLGASGGVGPKLRQGDRQVPEGVYAVESLNPNSRFHLSLRLNYPNGFDVARAREEGRTNLGEDIMIHGGHASIGCLAIGDPAIEELFVLVADLGIDKVRVILSPHDLRVKPPPRTPTGSWDERLYVELQREFAELEPIRE